MEIENILYLCSENLQAYEVRGLYSTDRDRLSLEW